jgi:hypothetical protein
VFFACLLPLVALSALAQEDVPSTGVTMYDVPPRRLVDAPTAGTLPRSYYDIGIWGYSNGGVLGFCNIGLSHRFSLGLSYGGEEVISNKNPNWNPRIGFNLKFRIVDELEYFPAITIGFSDQGFGTWNAEEDRYQFKSRGFFAVASRSFYLFKWTAGWHFGINYSRESEDDDDVNVWGGFDATFDYNLALMIEYDAGLNDDKGDAAYTGKGRGYLNISVKWLFTNNLELEVVLKDLLINRREAETFTREARITYISSF